MDVNRHVRVLDAIGASATNLMCQNCGLATPSLGQQGMCHSCESIISMSREALLNMSPDVVAALDDINARLAASDYEGAIAGYENLFAKRGDPQLLYAEGLACLMYSNYEVEQIRYDRQGFMEENTLLRDSAAKHAALARLLFAKTASLCVSAIAKADSPGLRYTAFLAYIKLGDYKAARAMKDALASSGSAYVHEYAEMVFSSAAGRFDEALVHAQELASPSSFSINAFFYMALALIKKKDRSGALKLLRALRKHVDSKAIAALEAEAAQR